MAEKNSKARGVLVQNLHDDVGHEEDTTVSREKHEGDGHPTPDRILFKADDLLVFYLWVWVVDCVPCSVNAVFMVGRVREVVDPLRGGNSSLCTMPFMPFALSPFGNALPSK